MLKYELELETKKNLIQYTGVILFEPGDLF
jgi:hypothetical protein